MIGRSRTVLMEAAMTEQTTEMQPGGKPGVVALLGSGETAALGRAAFVNVFRKLSQPIQVAVLDTPAGFQPNAALVAEKVDT